MGTSFTIDTPIKVAPYGISSVISLVDDTLIEQMREFYCRQMGWDYAPINKSDDDHRARRITAYLNLVDQIVQQKFMSVKEAPFEPDSEITRYFEYLNDDSLLKKDYRAMLQETNPQKKQQQQDDLRARMRPGRIDVNIMTKLNRSNYRKNKELPMEFADALAALRGYAKSTLESAIVFSAGLNRHLYSYVEKFEDFYANASGYIKKKIILKVSDYRSSLIQGRFFAKKGIWVSEFRVESGLNCGGHAFPSKGFLIGPILNEFKKKRDELIAVLHKTYKRALEAKKRITFPHPHPTRVTAQGGITTAHEDRLLLDEYQVDGTGWGTPFLLVPEAVNVDAPTLDKLIKATEDDLYLSDVSPVGAPFNNLRNSASEQKKQERIREGHPGSPCFKGHLRFNTEFTEQPICVASREYQKHKLEELAQQQLPEQEYQQAYNRITDKSCICHDLGAAAVLKNRIVQNAKNLFSAICPGPSMAHFNQVSSLADMIDHIYGRINLLAQEPQQNLFIKDLKMTVVYFMDEVSHCTLKPTAKQIEALNEIKQNILDGIVYYREFFPRVMQESRQYKEKAMDELYHIMENIDNFLSEHTHIFEPPCPNMNAS
jgi:hypothetical protein